MGVQFLDSLRMKTSQMLIAFGALLLAVAWVISGGAGSAVEEVYTADGTDAPAGGGYEPEGAKEQPLQRPVDSLDGSPCPPEKQEEFDKHFLAGIKLQREQRHPEAVQSFEAALALHGESGELLTALASSLHSADLKNENGGLDKAIMMHRQAVALVQIEHPKYPYFLLNYATALLNKDAAKYSERCIDLLADCKGNPDCDKYSAYLKKKFGSDEEEVAEVVEEESPVVEL